MDATLEGLPMNSLALLYPVGLARTPKGVVIEGRGVSPDMEVNLTRAEQVAQLEARFSTSGIDELRLRRNENRRLCDYPMLPPLT
jgi:C-terminal processing protease CtpA/Prc